MIDTEPNTKYQNNNISHDSCCKTRNNYMIMVLCRRGEHHARYILITIIVVNYYTLSDILSSFDRHRLVEVRKRFRFAIKTQHIAPPTTSSTVHCPTVRRPTNIRVNDHLSIKLIRCSSTHTQWQVLRRLSS